MVIRNNAVQMLTHAVLGACVLVSYVVVIGNAFGGFALQEPSASYFDSPWWAGMPPATARMLTVIQLPAGVGALVWYQWAFGDDPVVSAHRHLPRLRDLLVTTFLVASLLWAPLSYRALQFKTLGSAVLPVASLAISAVCSILALAFTFETGPPPAPTLGILALSMVVVLVDGVGWSAALLYRTIYA